VDHCGAPQKAEIGPQNCVWRSISLRRVYEWVILAGERIHGATVISRSARMGDYDGALLQPVAPRANTFPCNMTHPKGVLSSDPAKLTGSSAGARLDEESSVPPSWRGQSRHPAAKVYRLAANPDG